jgi:hypothetical protein
MPGSTARAFAAALPQTKAPTLTTAPSAVVLMSATVQFRENRRMALNIAVRRRVINMIGRWVPLTPVTHPPHRLPTQRRLRTPSLRSRKASTRQQRPCFGYAPPYYF